jgi:trans-aconitate methyltransferase
MSCPLSTDDQADENKQWDTSLYDGKHSFVWKYAAGVIDLLAPVAGERILDLGCGTGHLTKKIASTGADVTGLDHSKAMIEEARKLYPDIRFEIADGTDFHFDKPFDAVFSNAALHWMRKPASVIGCVWDALKPGGRFVAEMGGKGNLEALHAAINSAIAARGIKPLEESSLLFFPSIGEYATLLERGGFRVTYAMHFDRPTPLDEGDKGLRNWIAMFGDKFIGVAPSELHEEIIREVEDRLRPVLYREGTWFADYRRLRFSAVKSNRQDRTGFA